MLPKVVGTIGILVRFPCQLPIATHIVCRCFFRIPSRFLKLSLLNWEELEVFVGGIIVLLVLVWNWYWYWLDMEVQNNSHGCSLRLLLLRALYATLTGTIVYFPRQWLNNAII